MLRCGRQELANMLNNGMIVHFFKPSKLYNSAVQMDELAEYFRCTFQHLRSAVIDIVEQKLPQILLLCIRYMRPMVRDKRNKSRGSEE